MISRHRLLAPVVLAALAGCDGLGKPGPLAYSRSELAVTELADKPALRGAVDAALTRRFGASPDAIVVPKGTGLFDGGRRLAAEFVDGGKADRYDDHPAGGYALYQKHCLHCHGVSGDGRGPTAAYLFPRPRDYRRGLYKFTSTTGDKPARDDLRRTLVKGLEGTSMPSFEASMTKSEIDQVLDYMIFLSIRGEVERKLIYVAAENEDKDAPTALPDDVVDGVIEAVASSWKEAEGQVLAASTSRTPSDDASILRGRDLFLGRTKEKLECSGCHGPRALGNGPSFVDQAVVDDVVYWGYGDRKKLDYQAVALFDQVASKSGGTEVELPVADLAPTVPAPKGFESVAPTPTADLIEVLASRGYLKRVGADKVRLAAKPEGRALAAIRAEREIWEKSLDEWDNPLRPANLNANQYKGGRRPIDLYWRIAKGIKGAKMMEHLPLFQDHPERIWDIVNFVLALPDRPELLDAPGPAPSAAAPSASARPIDAGRLAARPGR